MKFTFRFNPQTWLLVFTFLSCRWIVVKTTSDSCEYRLSSYIYPIYFISTQPVLFLIYELRILHNPLYFLFDQAPTMHRYGHSTWKRRNYPPVINRQLISIRIPLSSSICLPSTTSPTKKSVNRIRSLVQIQAKRVSTAVENFYVVFLL